MKLNNINLNIPKNTKIFVWKNIKTDFIKILISNDTKVFKFIFINNNNIFIDKWNHSIVIFKNSLLTKNKINLILNEFLISWNFFFFKKIKFKGKGFKIKFFKKTKLIKFYFGKSHKTFIKLNFLSKKKINKYKFIVTTIKKINFFKINTFIKKIKKINIYTLRGIRFSRQIIFKRKGKKGTYI